MTVSALVRAVPRRPTGAHRASEGNASVLLAANGLLLFVIPPRFAVGASGFSFNSATLLGLISLFVWLLAALAGHERTTFNPVRWATLLFAAGALLSLGVAYGRPLLPDEGNSALRTFAITLGYVGLALLMCDGLRSSQGIRRVIGWTLAGSYFSAAIAVAQKLVGFPYVSYWERVPGLRVNLVDSMGPLLDGRATGTEIHPIALAVVSASLVGLSLHQFMHSSGKVKRLHGAGAFLLVIATLLAISRSGIVALLLAALVMLPAMPLRQRLNSLAILLLGAVLVQVFAHGTLSTLQYQLSHTGSDQSSQGRLEDYGRLFILVDKHLWNGLGNGTFNPQDYFTLDNSWLGTLVSGGIVGTAILATLFLVGLQAGRFGSRHSYEPYLAGVARAATAGLLALGVSAYFFDEFNFPQPANAFFLLLGLIGAVRGLIGENPPPGPRVQGSRERTAGR